MIAKWALKKTFFKEKISCCFLATAQTRMYSHKKGFILTLTPARLFTIKRRRKEIFNFLKLLWGRYWLQLNEEKSMESQTRLIISWCWKRKPTWRKDLITYNSHPRIMFPCVWLVIIWRGDSFEIGNWFSFDLPSVPKTWPVWQHFFVWYKKKFIRSINELKTNQKKAFYFFKGALWGLGQFLTTESPAKLMKNVFYFILKALFVLKIFKFLSWRFVHV